jgi:hypothetical protein
MGFQLRSYDKQRGALQLTWILQSGGIYCSIKLPRSGLLEPKRGADGVKIAVSRKGRAELILI